MEPQMETASMCPMPNTIKQLLFLTENIMQHRLALNSGCRYVDEVGFDFPILYQMLGWQICMPYFTQIMVLFICFKAEIKRMKKIRQNSYNIQEAV